MTHMCRPGDIVKARDREWVVAEMSGALVGLRPLAGADDEIQWILPGLGGPDEVVSATFPMPSTDQMGTREQMLLLRDALSLSIRRGAGPFRSAASICFSPRSYQLAPLMMALKMDVVRLMIADDVGIGKTVEAGLIVRELMERAEIARFAVLCPPHLVDQWVSELATKFEIHATAVTAESTPRLEKDLPPNESLFKYHPYSVVSLDYIKGPSRINEFVREAPELIVVDEAHGCVSGNEQRHRRYELLQRLASYEARHLVLLTATPHSGNRDAFYRLLGLLDAEFVNLLDAQGGIRRELRAKLSDHLIQRRREDIKRWPDGLDAFPRHIEEDAKYRLTPEHDLFLTDVLDYCRDVVTSVGDDERRQRLAYWGTLALMRCVASSPAAAVSALTARARNTESIVEPDAEQGIAEVLDLSETDEGVDVEPDLVVGDARLGALIDTARKLFERPAANPKFIKLREVVSQLRESGHAPIVFCRYISTAKSVADFLRSSLRGADVAVVTGEMTSEERKLAVEEHGIRDGRILVATECLSEGINLQEFYSAVVHFDLSWNPTKHQQREGRVDRFGQKSETVRTVMIYGEDNPVDGAVLDVILRGAIEIRKELGVTVTLPQDDRAVSKAVLRSAIMRGKTAKPQKQFTLDLGDPQPELELSVRRTVESERKIRTIFSQARLRPEDVVREWEVARSFLGTTEEVVTFVKRAVRQLGGEAREEAGSLVFLPRGFPDSLSDRLEPLLVDGAIRIQTSGSGAITRSHPVVVALASHLLEATLEAEGEVGLPRAAVWRSRSAEKAITLALVRCRHRVTTTRRAAKDAPLEERSQIAEEVGALAFLGIEGTPAAQGALAVKALDLSVDMDLEAPAARMQTARALVRIEQNADALRQHADARAHALAEDHRRVARAAAGRDAQIDVGVARIEPIHPLDVVGVVTILPAI